MAVAHNICGQSTCQRVVLAWSRSYSIYETNLFLHQPSEVLNIKHKPAQYFPFTCTLTQVKILRI